MIKYVQGNLFATEAKTITVPVNCVGVMGGGIAKTARERCPELFARYKKLCKAGEMKPGHPVETMGGQYLLFPTKDHWRNPSQYPWIRQGLEKIRENAHRLKSIAIPPLGCGHGGLNWGVVDRIIHATLAGLELPILVYPPRRTGRDRALPEEKAELSNRASQIQRICKERGITTLCHFTRIENLHSILRQGLLGKSVLKKHGQQFLFNDDKRLDRCPQANCLSISFPNDKMFYSIREEKKKAQEANDSQWVVLVLDAKILWEFVCAFCKENAASNAIREVDLEDRKKPDVLEGMFVDDYRDIRGKVYQRHSLQIPENYPTHPQAEVLVFDTIPAEYINEVHFYDDTALQTWSKDNPEAYSQKFCANPRYFESRQCESQQELGTMAKRPIFIPNLNEFPYVETIDIEFKWYPGFAKSQLQKSIVSLHEAAEKQGIAPLLEISGKSASRRGVALNAFNLPLKTPSGQTMSVECAYQGSKVFENGGPYHELYSVSSRAAKTDERLRNSGELVAFNFFGEDFPTEPKTAFYDWLYITALYQQKTDFMRELEAFQGFSDIVFNPNRSINCQARAAALFVALSKNELIDEQALQDRDSYLAFITGKAQLLPTEPTLHQLTLPLR